MNIIPKGFQDLLQDEKRAFAFLATTMKDGSPQVTPVWFNTDGTYLLINSAKGRSKDRNMRRSPKVALAISDPDNPYRYMQIRGTIVEITEEGASEHIDALSGKYTGNFRYQGRQTGEQRVKYKIQVEKVNTMG